MRRHNRGRGKVVRNHSGLTLSMWWFTHSLKVGALNLTYGGVTHLTQVVGVVALLTWELGQLITYVASGEVTSLSIWWHKSHKSSYVAVVEGKIPCSTISSLSPWMKAED